MTRKEPKAFTRTDTNIRQVMDLFVTNRISQLDTVMIGIIEKFDPETQTAQIKPAINKWNKTETLEEYIYETGEHPLYVNIPVIFPSGGDWVMTFPVKKGDECIILAVQRDSSKWRETGGLSDPSSFTRKYSFKDAVAFVGLNSKATALEDFNADEPEMRNRDGSVKFTMGSEGLTLDGNLTVKGTIQATDEISSDGEVSANASTSPSTLSQHQHPSGSAVATTGTASAQTGTVTSPILAPTPGT